MDEWMMNGQMSGWMDEQVDKRYQLNISIMAQQISVPFQILITIKTTVSSIVEASF